MNDTGENNARVFAVHSIGDIFVVTLQGDAQQFRHSDIQLQANAVTTELRTSDARGLLFDFGDHELSSSVMIGAAVRIGRQFRGAVVFCGQSPSVNAVYESMNLTKLWPFFQTREAALASFDT